MNILKRSGSRTRCALVLILLVAFAFALIPSVSYAGNDFAPQPGRDDAFDDTKDSGWGKMKKPNATIITAIYYGCMERIGLKSPNSTQETETPPNEEVQPKVTENR